MLRDFVYLDWERVRSLAAQLFQGVPETSTRERGSSLAVEGRIEGGVLNLLKGQAGVDYRYFRADNETRSFHHHVYNQVEDQLDQVKLITKVDSDFDFDGWTRDMFRDGQFVLVTGIVRLMDFGWVSAMMEALPKLMRAVHHSEDLSLKQLMEQGQLTQREFEARKKDQQRQLSDIQALKIDQLTTIVRQIYGNVVRVKVLPSRAHPENVLVGTGDLPNFHDTEASLAQKYGYEVDAGWTVLGQVNVPSETGEPLQIPVGNSMEDAFEKVALSFNQLMRVASAPKFPAISFTPISIYRTLT